MVQVTSSGKWVYLNPRSVINRKLFPSGILNHTFVFTSGMDDKKWKSQVI